MNRVQKLAMFTMLSLLAMPMASPAAQSLPEPLATILRIALFIDWPEHNRPTNDEFKLCLTSSPPRLKLPLPQVHGKPLSIVKLNPQEDNSDCQILFLDEGGHTELQYHLTQAANMPVLVLAQKPIGADIQLWQSGHRYHFHINTGALLRRHLHAHPQLLKLSQPHTPTLH